MANANAHTHNGRNNVAPRPAIKDAVLALVKRLRVSDSAIAKGYDPLVKPVMVEGYGKLTPLALSVDVGNGQTETAKWVGLVDGNVRFSAWPKPGFEPFTFHAYCKLRGYTDAEVATVVRTKSGTRMDGSEWRQSFLVGHLPELPTNGRRSAATVPVPVDARAVAVSGL